MACTAAIIAPTLAPVGFAVDGHDALPRRHGEAVVADERLGSRRRRDTDAVLGERGRQLDRRGGRCGRPPDAQDHRTGRVDGVHPHPHERRRVEAPRPAPPRQPPVVVAATGRRADRRRTGAPAASPRRSAIEHVDAGVEPAGRVEAALDPPVQGDDRRVRLSPRRRLAVVDDADADLGHERAAQRADRRRRDRPAPAGRQRRRPARRLAGRAARTWASTSRSSPSSSTHVVVPSHSTDVGRYSRASASSGSMRPLNHCSYRARGRVRRMTSPMKPSVPRDPTSSRHTSKPLTFFTVGPPALTISPAAET